MPGVVGALSAALLASVLVGPAAAVPTPGPLFRFADPRITESSGLVDLGGSMVTVNDSGNAPDVFVVDARSGRTVGLTHLSADTVDIEALAPAGRSRVWVADIGDNSAVRRSVELYRVPVAAGRRLEVRPAAYRLRYPDGPHDAESLFVDRSGRPYVVTKGLTGGAVYRTPRQLSSRRDNRLVRVGRVGEFATDAAMMRDGRHLLVRGYGAATVYTWPGLRRLAGFDLPVQPQGEGLSVGPGGRIRLSSEGVRSRVLQVALPPAVTRLLAPAARSRSQAPAAASSDPGDEHRGRLPWQRPLVILVGAVGLAAAVVAGRRRAR